MQKLQNSITKYRINCLRMRSQSMLDLLTPYYRYGHFFFQSTDSLNDVCNAPKGSSGVYLVYALESSKTSLVYIGSAGELLHEGKFKEQKLYDRIANGKQFGDKRKFTWPKQMGEEGINTLDVYWFETFKEGAEHLPKYVEAVLIQNYFLLFRKLPRWNKKY